MLLMSHHMSSGAIWMETVEYDIQTDKNGIVDRTLHSGLFFFGVFCEKLMSAFSDCLLVAARGREPEWNMQ